MITEQAEGKCEGFTSFLGICFFLVLGTLCDLEPCGFRKSGSPAETSNPLSSYAPNKISWNTDLTALFQVRITAKQTEHSLYMTLCVISQEGNYIHLNTLVICMCKASVISVSDNALHTNEFKDSYTAEQQATAAGRLDWNWKRQRRDGGVRREVPEMLVRGDKGVWIRNVEQIQRNHSLLFPYRQSV